MLQELLLELLDAVLELRRVLALVVADEQEGVGEGGERAGEVAQLVAGAAEELRHPRSKGL